MKTILILLVLLFMAMNCSYAQRDTNLVSLNNLATSTWKKIDFGSEKSTSGWFTNDATAAGDSILVGFGFTAYVDTSSGRRTTVKAGEVLPVGPRTFRSFWFKKAGTNDVACRAELMR
jgi:hypothetical protein